MAAAVNRQFYSLPKDSSSWSSKSQDDSTELGNGVPKQHRNHQSTEESLISNSSLEPDLLSYISKNVIGANKTFSGPFGLRTVTYLDYVASGRALQFIENYIANEVLPEYGNTHTTTSITSLQTTLFRHEARDIIRNTCNASEHDAVVFAGSGATGAVHKLLHSLQLKTSPIVFIGPYEHHSNILPWIEMGAEVIRISQTDSGHISLHDLETRLKESQGAGRQLIGAFSAASNVSGVLTDVDAVTVSLHRHGALACWDYATAAPYVKIDMNPYVGGPDQHLVYKDAIYFSMHKFIGGVDCPGVLIAKKSLLKNAVPDQCGGGTVFFVRRDSHRYLQEPEMKEEGGTPAIVGSIRAGLVLQLKEAVGTDLIQQKDDWLFGEAERAWSNCPNLVLLAPTTPKRLPVFSFLVYHPESGRFLHHNFVASILNDVFGIQARGGCACAGPYAMDLLGMDEEISEKIEQLLVEDSRLDRVHLRRFREYSHREILRPGFVRINLPYFLDQGELDFVLQAVALTAENAWKLLPQYLFNPETGEWRHKQFQTFKDRKWLGHISYSSGKMSYHQPPQRVRGPLPTSYQDCLDKAMVIFDQAHKLSLKVPDQTVMFDEEAKPFRWFVLPSESYDCLTSPGSLKPMSLPDLPFCPAGLLQRLGFQHEAKGKLALATAVSTKLVGDCFQNSQAKCYYRSENHVVAQETNASQLTENSTAEFRDKLKSDLKGNTGVNMKVTISPGKDKKNGDSVGEKLTNDKHVSDFSQLQSGLGTTASSRAPFYSGMIDALSDGFVGKMQISDANTHPVSQETFQDAFVLMQHTSERDTSISSNNTANTCSLITTANTAKTNIRINMASDTKDNSVTDKKSGPAKKEEKHSQETAQAEASSAPSYACPLRRPSKPEPSAQDGSSSSEKPRDEHSEMQTQQKSLSTPGVRWWPPPKSIFKPTLAALEEYGMLKGGDKVLVCLSGGKDSLSLLHTVRQYQFYAKGQGINFEFGAVTVDPQTPAYDPSPLKAYLASLGVPYFYESQCILDTANNLPYGCASICSFCSRMKRGRIYAAARREGYNVLALGQHLDDLSESFLMSFFHNGALNTMKAHYTIKQGDLRVIRPFVYVRESDLRKFAEQKKLPVIAENCPACFEAPKERHRTKQLLASQEVLFPQVYSSMMSALRPLMAKQCMGKVAGEKKEGEDEDDDEE